MLVQWTCKLLPPLNSLIRCSSGIQLQQQWGASLQISTEHVITGFLAGISSVWLSCLKKGHRFISRFWLFDYPHYLPRHAASLAYQCSPSAGMQDSLYDPSNCAFSKFKIKLLKSNFVKTYAVIYKSIPSNQDLKYLTISYHIYWAPMFIDPINTLYWCYALVSQWVFKFRTFIR